MNDSTPYPHLFSPIHVGERTLKNRILMPAMDLHFTPGGEINDRIVTFYRERAFGGPAMIVVGGCRISRDAAQDQFIGIHEDRFVPGLKRLSAAIREGGALPVAQLYHAGRYLRPPSPDIQPIAPSAVLSRLAGVTPKPMTFEDIRRVVGDYVRAAERALEAGFEGVEVIGSAGYLPAQFASKVTNLREDEYGGDLTNRSRFGRELLAAVRKAVPSPNLLLYRMGFSDLVPGGIEGDEAVELARLLAAEGLDMLSLTGGWHEARVPMITMDVPRGAFLPEMKPFKDALSIPVAGANRINRPEVAEKALEKGLVDMTAVARAFIADPQWGIKAKRGETKTILPCTGCNEACLDAIFRDRAVTCALNPMAGLETGRAMPRARRTRRIAVLGSGPSGLNAAIWLKESGHQVAIFEKGGEPGGLLRIAHRAPGKAELKTYLEYLLAEIERLNIPLKTAWDGSLNDAKTFEALVLSPGRTDTSFQGAVHPEHRMIPFQRALLLEAPPEGPGIVIGGGETGVETALYLKKLGADVTVVHRHKKLAVDLGPSTRWVVLMHLKEAGVEAVHGEVVRLTRDECIHKDKTGREMHIPARWSVWAVAGALQRPDEIEMPPALRRLPRVFLGDAWSEGRIMHWTDQAYRLACRWSSL